MLRFPRFAGLPLGAGEEVMLKSQRVHDAIIGEIQHFDGSGK
jgi:hypothetical protein